MEISNMSREELYEKVWTVPRAALAEELGLSDVIIRKTCHRLQIPRPPRGYWTRLSSGKKVKRARLPKMGKAELRRIALGKDPTLEEGEADVLLEIEPLKRINLPANFRKIHPIARLLRDVLSQTSPSKYDHGLLVIKEHKELPRVSVSKEMIRPFVCSFHALISELEARGVEFKASRSKYESGAFCCGEDRLSLTFDEPIIREQREPTDFELRIPSWEWRLSYEKPGGRLNCKLSSGPYDRRTHSIAQKTGVSLEEFTAQVVEKVWDTFMGYRQERLEDLKRQKRLAIDRAEQDARERIADHAKKLKAVSDRRKESLVRAAQWWSIRNTVSDYIKFCEQRWLTASIELSADERAWLEWAKQFVGTMPNANFDYPDPGEDGSFDPETVPVGGPYPPVKHIPRPPTMPKPSETKKDRECREPYRNVEPYPFWLKYGR